MRLQNLKPQLKKFTFYTLKMRFFFEISPFDVRLSPYKISGWAYVYDFGQYWAGLSNYEIAIN